MRNQYDLVVYSNLSVTPHMRRIKLHGESLKAFPTGQETGYVKVDFSKHKNTKIMRSYTIRAFDPERRLLTLDFVDHGDLGPASRWARQAKKGASIRIFGPGATKILDPHADWYLIGGDMSALPAIGANLEALRADAKGYVIVEILSQEDQQLLNLPTGMEVIWLIQEDSDLPNKQLVETIRAVNWLPGRVYPWFAGEFDGMRNMRAYFRDEKNIDIHSMYLSCYWKLGATDEGMKRAKRIDAESDLEGTNIQ